MKKIVIVLLLCFSMPLFAGNVIVVHKDNDTSLSLSDAKKIYLGRSGAFDNGTRAVPVTLAEGHAIRADFNRTILNKSESQYSGYWAKMSFTGRAIPPKEMTNSKEVKDFVAGNVNAVGIMNDEFVDDSVRIVARF